MTFQALILVFDTDFIKLLPARPHMAAVLLFIPLFRFYKLPHQRVYVIQEPVVGNLIQQPDDLFSSVHTKYFLSCHT